MQLTLLRGDPRCSDGRTCPNINATDRADRRTLVVQGYTVQPTADGEARVEVPDIMLPELAGVSRPGVVFTDHGTALISGTPVTDPEALAQLHLPTGESAVEIPVETLAELVSRAG